MKTKHIRTSIFRAVLVTMVVTMAGSCSFYSTKSATTGDIKSIYVPFFENQTNEPDLELTITEKIIDALIEDNTLKVTSEQRADAILKGRVVIFQNKPFSFNEDLNAEEYIVRISVSASLLNTKTADPIWENKSFSHRFSYYIDSIEGGATFDEAVDAVVKEITKNIISETVQDW